MISAVSHLLLRATDLVKFHSDRHVEGIVLRAIVAIFMFGVAMLSLASGKHAAEESKNGVTHEDLVRRTQELVDAIPVGDQNAVEKIFRR